MRRLFVVLWLAGYASAAITTQDTQPLGRRIPVILIHGWHGSPESWDAFVQRAGANPELGRRVKLYRFAYDWSRSIATSANLLRNDLETEGELRGRPVVLVGHSMGGLVARTYLEGRWPGWDGPHRVAGLITLGTPHRGSPAANIDWLGGDSKYSLLTKLIPLGVLQLLDLIPMMRAVRSEGGVQLGWDNSDGAMPPVLWASASRYLRDLNDALAVHPDRDELLWRYALHAGYLETVPALTATGLPQLIRSGQHYQAGCALLAHAYRDGTGKTVDHWALNDGVVPLESACFLSAGTPVVTRQGERYQLQSDTLTRRLARPGIVAALWPGVDHSGLTTDFRVVGNVLGALAKLELSALWLYADGRPAWYEPRQETSWRVDALPAGDRVLAAPDAGWVVVQRGNALARATPDGSEPVARSESERSWVLSPDASRAVSLGGVLVGVRDPAYLRLGGPLSRALWSPDGRRLAATDESDRLILANAALLTAEAASEEAPGLRPLAWSPDGRRLLVAQNDGPREAVFSGDGKFVAVVTAGPAELQVIDPAGGAGAKWTVDAPEGGHRLVVLDATDGSTTVVAEQARGPIWSPDGAWLAWIDGDVAVGLRRAGITRTAKLESGVFTALAAVDETTLVGALSGGAGGLVAVDAVTGSLVSLAGARPAPVGPPLVSPDRWYAALPLESGDVLVAAIDGSWSVLLQGRNPVWATIPCGHRWVGRPAFVP